MMGLSNSQPSHGRKEVGKRVVNSTTGWSHIVMVHQLMEKSLYYCRVCCQSLFNRAEAEWHNDSYQHKLTCETGGTSPHGANKPPIIVLPQAKNVCCTLQTSPITRPLSCNNLREHKGIDGQLQTPSARFKEKPIMIIDLTDDNSQTASGHVGKNRTSEDNVLEHSSRISKPSNQTVIEDKRRTSFYPPFHSQNPTKHSSHETSQYYTIPVKPRQSVCYGSFKIPQLNTITEVKNHQRTRDGSVRFECSFEETLDHYDVSLSEIENFKNGTIAARNYLEKLKDSNFGLEPLKWREISTSSDTADLVAKILLLKCGSQTYSPSSILTQPSSTEGSEQSSDARCSRDLWGREKIDEEQVQDDDSVTIVDESPFRDQSFLEFLPTSHRTDLSASGGARVLNILSDEAASAYEEDPHLARGHHDSPFPDLDLYVNTNVNHRVLKDPRLAMPLRVKLNKINLEDYEHMLIDETNLRMHNDTLKIKVEPGTLKLDTATSVGPTYFTLNGGLAPIELDSDSSQSEH